MKKRLLSALMAATMTISLTANAFAASVSDFTDVSTSDWYYSAVNYAVSNNLFNGTSNTTFTPSAPMTRAMFVTVLGRLSGVDTSSYTSTAFTDVQSSSYYAPYVAWVSAKGIVNGTSASTFSPDGQITREQIAKILYGYAVDAGTDTVFTTTGKATYEAFSDYATVSDYAAQGMRWCVQESVLNGSNNKLDPQGTATRAQVAQILMNADALLKGTTSNNATETPSNDTNNNTQDDTNTTIDYNIDEINQRKTGVSAVDSYGGYWHYDLANATFDAVNELRVENGKDALKFSTKLEGYSATRAYELAVVYDRDGAISHTRPNGTSATTVGTGVNGENALLSGSGLLENPPIDEDGNVYYWKEEVVASNGVEQQVEIVKLTYAEYIEMIGNGAAQQWFNSADHKTNMLLASYKCGAVGIYIKDGYLYAIQLFSNQTVNTVNSYVS